MAFAAYGSWGLFPLFWKQLGHTPALEQLAHRISWALVVYLGLLLVTRQFGGWLAALRERRNRRVLAVTAALVGINWYLYIFAIEQSMILQASLGYFINPLVNVVLGVALPQESAFAGLQKDRGRASRSCGHLAIMAQPAPARGYGSACASPGSFGTYGLLAQDGPRSTSLPGADDRSPLPGALLPGRHRATLESSRSAGTSLSVDAKTTALLFGGWDRHRRALAVVRGRGSAHSAEHARLHSVPRAHRTIPARRVRLRRAGG